MKGDLQGHADHFRRASRVHSLVTTGSSSECLTQEPSTHWPLPGGGSLRLESVVHSAPRCSPWEDKERGETSWCRQGMKSCVLWETGLLYLRYSIKEDITKTRGGEIHEVRFRVLREKVLRVPQVPQKLHLTGKCGNRSWHVNTVTGLKIPGPQVRSHSSQCFRKRATTRWVHSEKPRDLLVSYPSWQFPTELAPKAYAVPQVFSTSWVNWGPSPHTYQAAMVLAWVLPFTHRG